ncbi:HAMP domain-containing protein, partial [Acinetobacter baumannii]
LNETLAQRSQQEVDRRNDALLTDLEHERQLISGLVIGALGLAALFAFGFGWWLSRPMKRIGQAIERLGGNQFDQPITVKGP